MDVLRTGTADHDEPFWFLGYFSSESDLTIGLLDAKNIPIQSERTTVQSVQKCQAYLRLLYQWLATAGLLCVFMLRIVFAQGVSLLHFSFAHDNEPDSYSYILQCYIGLFVFFFIFHETDPLI